MDSRTSETYLDASKHRAEARLFCPRTTLSCQEQVHQPTIHGEDHVQSRGCQSHRENREVFPAAEQVIHKPTERSYILLVLTSTKSVLRGTGEKVLD